MLISLVPISVLKLVCRLEVRAYKEVPHSRVTIRQSWKEVCLVFTPLGALWFWNPLLFTLLLKLTTAIHTRHSNFLLFSGITGVTLSYLLHL